MKRKCKYCGSKMIYGKTRKGKITGRCEECGNWDVLTPLSEIEQLGLNATKARDQVDVICELLKQVRERTDKDEIIKLKEHMKLYDKAFSDLESRVKKLEGEKEKIDIQKEYEKLVPHSVSSRKDKQDILNTIGPLAQSLMPESWSKKNTSNENCTTCHYRGERIGLTIECQKWNILKKKHILMPEKMKCQFYEMHDSYYFGTNKAQI